MEWIRMIGVCFLASILVVILKQLNPAVAGILCSALGLILLGLLLPEIRQYVEDIRRFLFGVGLENEYYQTLFNAVGVVMITQIVQQVCCDIGAPSVAEHVELCGRLAMLGIAVPVFFDLTQMAIGVLR